MYIDPTKTVATWTWPIPVNANGLGNACTTGAQQWTAIVGGVPVVRSSLVFFRCEPVYTKADFDEKIEEMLDNASTQMKALRAIAGTIQSQCITPSTGAPIVSAACTGLRNKAAAIGPSAAAANDFWTDAIAIRSTLP